MFYHDKPLQYHARPERPDPQFAKRVQEVLGGQFGEMTVMMQYLFQGWNCRGPAKYKDMLLDIGTEEIGHVEMLCTLIARLLEGAPVSEQEAMVAANPGVAAVMGGINPQHLIVAGGGALPTNSMGVPWNAGYMVASGNLMADFYHNATAEMQGRLQVTRLFNMTSDPGIRDMFAFMIARDAMHQNQWLAAIEELQRDGLEQLPVPGTFPPELQINSVAYQFWNHSAGTESKQGSWASGPSPDGHGEFEYLANPRPLAEEPEPPPAPHPLLYGTDRQPMPPVVAADVLNNGNASHKPPLGKNSGDRL